MKPLDELLADMTDHVHELTRSYRTAASHLRLEKAGFESRIHRQVNECLIHQLEEQAGTTSPEEQQARPQPASRMPGDPEALTYLLTITQEARMLTRSCRLKPRPVLTDTITQLAAHARAIATGAEDDARYIADHITAWHLKARYGTGWATRPFHPNATCPALLDHPEHGEYICGRKTLLVAADGSAASCMSCGCRWTTAEQVAILAEHIASDPTTKVAG